MMKRRNILTLIKLSPLALVSATSSSSNPLVEILITRWKKSKEYSLAVFNAMPEEFIEFSPSKEQMTFAQHFIYLGFFNNMFMCIMIDQIGLTDTKSLFSEKCLLERPDELALFEHAQLNQRPVSANKQLVSEYITKTHDFVTSTLAIINDEALSKGKQKPKHEAFEGHSNLDFILRGENHTAHHRAQAVTYLRMKGITPPSYRDYNIL